MEFKIKSLGNDFRIKKMNALEALALRNVIDFDDFETTLKMLNVIVEHIEVKCEDTWLPVKETGRDVFFPVGIEDNMLALNELVNVFLNDYFKPLFRKSDASKN